MAARPGVSVNVSSGVSDVSARVSCSLGTRHLAPRFRGSGISPRGARQRHFLSARQRGLWPVEPKASSRPSHPSANSQQPDVGFGFSGAGLLFPYYIGVVDRLQEAGALRQGSKVAGASAGSIIAVATVCGVEMSTVTDGCKDVFKNYRRWGTAGRMRETLADTLHQLLPDDAHERCKDIAYVAVTQLMPYLSSEALTDFSCKRDLIASLLTSCHIPLYFDSYIETFFRKGLYMDGCVGQFLPEPPGCRHVVKISAMPTSVAANMLGHKWDIAPDVFNPLSGLTLPRSIVQALLPVSDMEFDDLIGQGREDASTWLQGKGRLI